MDMQKERELLRELFKRLDAAEWWTREKMQTHGYDEIGIRVRESFWGVKDFYQKEIDREGEVDAMPLRKEDVAYDNPIVGRLSNVRLVLGYACDSVEKEDILFWIKVQRGRCGGFSCFQALNGWRIFSMLRPWVDPASKLLSVRGLSTTDDSLVLHSQLSAFLGIAEAVQQINGRFNVGFNLNVDGGEVC